MAVSEDVHPMRWLLLREPHQGQAYLAPYRADGDPHETAPTLLRIATKRQARRLAPSGVADVHGPLRPAAVLRVRCGNDADAVALGLAPLAEVATVDDIPRIQTAGLFSNDFAPPAVRASNACRTAWTRWFGDAELHARWHRLRTSYLALTDRTAWCHAARDAFTAGDNRMTWLANHGPPELNLRAEG
ncbi:hypothetical protein [Streptomyces tauricus]|uniref:hypothetical protein n=1 Tax=Streptomyces tauricus TaxID=68274 RepID=UPI0033B51FE3